MKSTVLKNYTQIKSHISRYEAFESVVVDLNTLASYQLGLSHVIIGLKDPDIETIILEKINYCLTGLKGAVDDQRFSKAAVWEGYTHRIMAILKLYDPKESGEACRDALKRFEELKKAKEEALDKFMKEHSEMDIFDFSSRSPKDILARLCQDDAEKLKATVLTRFKAYTEIDLENLVDFSKLIEKLGKLVISFPDDIKETLQKELERLVGEVDRRNKKQEDQFKKALEKGNCKLMKQLIDKAVKAQNTELAEYYQDSICEHFGKLVTELAQEDKVTLDKIKTLAEYQEHLGEYIRRLKDTDSELFEEIQECQSRVYSNMDLLLGLIGKIKGRPLLS